jgi:hypothetical protein
MSTAAPRAQTTRSMNWRLVLIGVVALFWFVLTIVALVDGIRGGSLLFTAPPGGLVLPHLSLFGLVYLVSSGLMPFFVIGAIASA